MVVLHLIVLGVGSFCMLASISMILLYYRDWKFKHPLGMTKRKTYSIRTAKVGKNGLFSKEVIYTLFFTNFLSLLIGTGLGYVKSSS